MPDPTGSVPDTRVMALPSRVLSRQYRGPDCLSSGEVFAPGIGAQANRPVRTLLLNAKNHSRRVTGIFGGTHDGNQRQRQRRVATAESSVEASITVMSQLAASADI